MAVLPKASAVATVILEGCDDPAKEVLSGRFTMSWGGKTINKFREVKIPHVRDDGLVLPTLYLHFLNAEFRIGHGQVSHSLRAGSDMEEVMVKVPSRYFSPQFAERCTTLEDEVVAVVQALKSQGEVLVCDRVQKSAMVEDPGAMMFSLTTARPKAGISLDKKAFGIPSEAEQYLFANNHASVVHFDEDVRKAFVRCIEGLPELGFTEATHFATFLKVFYEGGFAYNKLVRVEDCYYAVNVGIAAMNVVPFFEGQSGIGTGYPYHLPAPFLKFVDSVPISIDGIKAMSSRHGRYGLTFTGAVSVWEANDFANSKTLEFCSVAPHGGFFYVPEKMKDHATLGGLVYAFGESANESSAEVSENA